MAVISVGHNEMCKGIEKGEIEEMSAFDHFFAARCNLLEIALVLME